MSANYIVMRASPDWLNFDIEETRPFCRKLNQRDDLLVEFAESWRRTFGISYCEIRHELKAITLSAIAATRDCELGNLADLNDPADDDLFVFMDDDDWTAPQLFETLRSVEPPPDGFFWGSIFLGRFLADAPGVYQAAGVAAGSPALQKRAIQDFLYTNNYAVTGRALKRLGIELLFEHYNALETLRVGQLLPAKVGSYLSCANKHLWCVNAVMHNSRSPGFLDRLYPALLDYAGALDDVAVDADTRWIAPYLDRLKALTAQVLALRC